LLNEDVSFEGSANALMPVTYAWDFGDGGLGSGQSVTHAYSNWGTYTVALEASQCGYTAVVTNTLTVQSCWSITSENFEGIFPPANWTVIDNIGGSCVWTRNDAFATPRPNYAGGQGFTADADSDRCGSGTTMDTELRTMLLDLSGADVTTAMVSYMTSYNDIGTGGDLADTDISVDGGATWTNLLQWDADHNATGPGELVTLDLTSYVGSANVMLRYHYYLATYDWWWEVDQVNVTACFVEGAQPDIAVTPLELTETLQANQTGDQLLNIANNGLLHLDWTIDVGCSNPVSWLSVSPTAGTLPAYVNTDVSGHFDATGLALGTYEAPSV
jgi:PKD repeat protein